jgi:poly-gamma-glutamate synthesis protein (capsule biosynthesis protein)
MNKSVLIIGLLLIICCQDVTAQNQEKDIRESRIAPEITFALAGDAIITRKISPYKEAQFLSMIDIIRKADVSFVNCEMQFFNYSDAYPAANSGGTWMHAAPELAEQLKWAGFDMCSVANNHSLDFGIQGLISTMATLRKAGLSFAGVGMNLAEARAPAYYESDAGRVALISVSSTFASGNEAGPQRKDLHGRPGLNPLWYKTIYTISEQSMKDLTRIGKETGVSVEKLKDGIHFSGSHFIAGTNTGRSTRPDEKNLHDILAEVGDASRQADWVIVNSHTHEGEGETPPEFLIAFAHAAIDAGADIVTAEGYHSNRPIEIYKGRPIFYSLADFIFENETVRRLPGDMYEKYGVSQDSLPGFLQDKRIEVSGSKSFVVDRGIWESFIAVPTFFNESNHQKKKLVSLKLYPITLGFLEPRPQRGRPRLADRKQGREIIEKLKKMSISYGTNIKYNADQNIGEVIFK